MAVKKTTTETNYCTMQLSSKCKNKSGILPVSNFYTANSRFYKNGKFNICKDCLKEYVYNKDGQIDINNFKDILRIYDLPFFEKEFKSAVSGEKETVGIYFKNIFLNYKDSSWVDSDDMQGKNVDVITNGYTDKDLVKRWGYGFSLNDLQWLEDDYKEWTTYNDCSKLSVQKLVQMICIKELEIRNARQDGKPTEKLEKALLTLMDSSSLTPKTMSASNASDSEKVFGVWIKDIEKTRPAEYFKDKQLYKDYDGLMDYFNRFVLRPLKNLLTGSREFDKEFSVEEPSTDEEVVDDE